MVTLGAGDRTTASLENFKHTESDVHISRQVINPYLDYGELMVQRRRGMHNITRSFETATTDGTERAAVNQDCLSPEGVVPGFRVVSSMQMGRVCMQLARFYLDC